MNQIKGKKKKKKEDPVYVLLMNTPTICVYMCIYACQYR